MEQSSVQEDGIQGDKRNGHVPQDGHPPPALESQYNAPKLFPASDQKNTEHLFDRGPSTIPPRSASVSQETPKRHDLGSTVGRSSSLRTPSTAFKPPPVSQLQQLNSPIFNLPQVATRTNTVQPIPLSPSPSQVDPHMVESFSQSHGLSSSDGLAALGSGSRIPHENDSALPSTASSPRLFTPTSSPLRQEFPPSEPSEPYSSPYLHYTHRQAPKETHLAEVERDPISGRKMINHYEIINELGRGVHGKVKLGRDLQNGALVAIKIIERVSKRKRLGRTGDQEDKIKREIAILKKARHPNIVGLLEVIDDPAKKKVYIILELAELGEVEWRTRGEDEICLVECRRNERELRGVFENDAELRQDQHILETAHRHIERRERQAWEEHQRLVRDGRITDIGPWSLEHGGESDYEPASPAISRQRSRTAAFILDSGDDDDHYEDPSDQTPHAELPHPHMHLNQGSDTVSSHGQSSFDGLQEFHHDFPNLEGTMYGAYDTSPHDREPSLLDSFASSHEDHFGEHIPEQYRYVPTMTLSDARRAIQDTVLGLEYLHYQGVVHRDIKPANLLQTKDHHIKISDFGVSYLGKAVNPQPDEDDQSETEAPKIDEALELAKTVGTPAFYAPELCNTDIDDENPPPVTNAIDIWALGVTLYCLVYGRVPFHHDSPFALMNKIAQEEVYIPRKRLKAVELPLDPSALPSPKQSAGNSNKRAAHDLEYEEVTDELYDLLKRLLTKDPRRRIILTEVKHHPWLLSGIKDPTRWIDDSDPSKLTQGKRIEVSKEDVDVAVVPLNLSDQILNITLKTARKITNAIGFGRSRSRRRAKSAADRAPSSNASSSSTISQDAKRHEQQRKGSLRPDELVTAALKSTRENEHPLSQSVTASPELREHPPFFEHPSHPESPLRQLDLQPERPSTLERGFSATGSVRTIRQSDILPLMSPGTTYPATFPSSPQALEHERTGIGGILGGAKKKILKGIQSRESRWPRGRIGSYDSPSPFDENTHAEPSLAFSNVVAAGHVNAPESLQDEHISSAVASPISSTGHSKNGSRDVFRPQSTNQLGSRQSSLSSVASRSIPGFPDTRSGHNNPQFLPLVGAPPSDGQTLTSFSQIQSTNEVARAKEEQIRRLMLEEEQNRNNQQSPAAAQVACPPSPDDLVPSSTYAAPVQETLQLGPSMLDYDKSAMPHFTTRSSEDQFMSGMSQSTSNPSLPSAYSADSSVVTDDVGIYHPSQGTAFSTTTHSLDDTLKPSQEDDDGYQGEVAYDDEDSSDESFIEIPSKKKPTSSGGHGRSKSSPVASSTKHKSQTIEADLDRPATSNSPDHLNAGP